MSDSSYDNQVLDLFYDVLDTWMREGRWDDCNDFLLRAIAHITRYDLLVGLLTITGPARLRIGAREQLYQHALYTLSHEHGVEYAEVVLKGLE